MAAIYTIKVKDGSGNYLGEFNRFKDLRFGKRMNHYGTASFKIPVLDPKAASLVALRIYTVEIYRDSVREWAGEQAMRSADLNEDGDNWLTLTCFTWFEQLFSRFTGSLRTFSAVDAGQIAWTLIDESQDDDSFGFTEGDIDTTMPRDRKYENKNIGEAIVELTNVINGFDCQINDSKAFEVFASQGVDRSDIILEYGRNIKSMTITEDFSQPINRAIILGSTGNPADALRVESEDATSITLYKLREAVFSEMTTSDTTTLEEKGEAVIRKNKSALFKVTLDLVRGTTPNIDQFALGDTIRLLVNYGTYNIDELVRIYEWNISYNDDDTEKLELVISNFIQSEFS